MGSDKNSLAKNHIIHLACRSRIQLAPAEVSRLMEVYSTHRETMLRLSERLDERDEPAFRFRPERSGP